MHRLAVLLATLALSACEPRDRTPGAWLSGELVSEVPENWHFTEAYPEVNLQTHPWYGIPFSVTVVIAADQGRVYAPSIYSEPADFPGTKYWNGVIADNPEVILRVGEKLYPRLATPVNDPVEFEAAFEALASKYDFWRTAKDDPAKRPPFVLIRLGDPG